MGNDEEDSAAEDRRAWTRWQQAGGTDLKELEILWVGRRVTEWSEEPGLYVDLARSAASLGDPFLAYDVAAAGWDLLQRTGRTRESAKLCSDLGNILGLALLETGALEGARRWVERLRSESLDTADTAGLEGRIYKASGVQESNLELRRKWFQCAREAYAAPLNGALKRWQNHPDSESAGEVTYLGINAATLALLADDRVASRELAELVEAVCRHESARVGGASDELSPWLNASWGEAGLLLGNLDLSGAAYRRAAAQAAGRVRMIRSMRDQARLVLAATGQDPTLADRWFGLPRLLVLEGGGDLPQWSEESGTEALVEVYGLLRDRTDLAAWVACSEKGYTLHPCLPAGDTALRATLEMWTGDHAMLNSVLSEARERAWDFPEFQDPAELPEYFFGQMVDGFVSLRANTLGAQVYRVRRDAGASTTPLPIPKQRDSPWEMRAMLFADVKGYSGLSTAELKTFNREYLGRIGAVTDRFRGDFLSIRTAGDGLFVVFDAVGKAVSFALALQEALQGVDWTQHGLPPGLGLRTSLDAGPVLTYLDPVMHKPEVGGPFVNRAARIEPITPPGEIYASETFAALARVQKVPMVLFEYAGRHVLPKRFGTVRLYLMRASNEAMV